MMGPAVCLFAAAAPCGAHSPYIAAGLITVAMGLSALTCSECPLLQCTGSRPVFVAVDLGDCSGDAFQLCM